MHLNPGDLWKRWLFNDLRDLREEEMQRQWWNDNATYRAVVVEQFTFTTAYIIRKLWENDELTVELTDYEWPVTRFECTSEPMSRSGFRISRDLKTWEQPIEQHYDLGQPRAETLRLQDLCNLIVHHFAFQVRGGAEAIEVFFNSDRTKGDRLYSQRLADYLDLVEEASHDEAEWFDVDHERNRQIRYRNRPPHM
jgi:hypothetical protein